MTKDLKRLLLSLMIMSIFFALVAFAVGIVALSLKEYIISAAMFIVAGWQVVNFFKWKKLL